MDSGSIVAVASRHLPRLATFTAGFELSAADGVEKTFDERREAELIANRFKTEHYELNPIWQSAVARPSLDQSAASCPRGVGGRHACPAGGGLGTGERCS